MFPRWDRIVLSPQGKKIPAQGGANEREEALKHSASLYKTRCKGAILQADIPAQGGGGCVEQPSLLSSSYEFFLLRPIHPKPTRPMPRSMRVEGSGTPTTGGSPPLPPFSPIRSAVPVKFATSRPAGLKRGADVWELICHGVLIAWHTHAMLTPSRSAIC